MEDKKQAEKRVKLNLNELKVKSFVTSLKRNEPVPTDLKSGITWEVGCWSGGGATRPTCTT